METNKKEELDMGIDQFQQIMVDEVKKKLGEEYEVEKNDTYKNNGVFYKGLRIRQKDNNIGMVPYLEDYSEMHQLGVPIERIVESLLFEVQTKSVPDKEIFKNVSFLDSYKKVKKNIQCRLINTKANEYYLKDIPNISFLDLSVIFYVAINGMDGVLGSIVIKNNLMEKWQLSIEDLYQDAMSNCKAYIDNLDDIIGSLLKEEGNIVESDFFKNRATKSVDMFVMGNKKKVYGASSILCVEELEKFAKSQNSNLFIIPSSVHESIIIPEAGTDKPLMYKLAHMVKSVNKTDVIREEVLSNSIYYFDREIKKVILLVEGKEI